MTDYDNIDRSELETVSLGNHTVWTHVPCPNCGAKGPDGLQDVAFGLRECGSCEELFAEELTEV